MIENFAPLYLAASSRLHGDGTLEIPKQIKSFLYSVPYGLAVYEMYPYAGNWLDWQLLLTPLTCGWVMAWKNTGHTDGFQNNVDDEFISPGVWYIAQKLDWERNSKKYDALFWTLKGTLIAGLPMTIIALGGDGWCYDAYAAAIAWTAMIGFPLGYYLGFNQLKNKLGLVNTAWGETLSGFFSGLGFLFRP